MKNSLLVALVSASLASSVTGAVIYRETFSSLQNNVTLASTGGASLNWSSIGATVWNVSSAAGRLQNVDNVNAGPSLHATLNSTGQLVNGLLYTPSGSSATLIYTNEYTIAASAIPNLTTFSWYQGNENTTQTARLAVQIDGNWYVYADGKANTTAVSGAAGFAGSPGAELMSVNWSSAGASWYDLGVSGNTLTLAGSARTLDLPDSAITGFGLYFGARTATQRFDTFQIEAVPEPASAALFGFAGICLALRRRRS